jgi:histidine kinase/DNA gyrase B/HSP90-like ATPase
MIVQPPKASAIVNSLRAIGYSFDTAIADIVDNSIAAKATDVQISFRTSPAYVAIADDGIGMSEFDLVSAMRHGGSGPTGAREPQDLGRYGLGLKTASLSQCRRLTVTTMHNGMFSAARWDLDEVERHDDWVLTLLTEEDLCDHPAIAAQLRTRRGTVVIWESFDLAIIGEHNAADALQKLVLDAGSHLGLVFHRYLAPKRGKALRIAVNERQLEAADPFVQANPFTEQVGTETRNVEGHAVRVRAFILPHINKMTADELERAGGKTRLRETQGFYVYRNRRLITWGTWFKLLGRDELTRLARIQIDIPNALDHLWGLDVKKSTASPPYVIRRVLQQIIHAVAAKSTNVFQERRRRDSSGRPVTYLWERTTIRGGVRYDLNRTHPLLSAFSRNLDPDQVRQLENILHSVELALPIRSIYVDQAASETVDQSGVDLELQLPAILEQLLEGTEADPDRRKALIRDLALIEPFKSYPVASRALLEALNDTSR